MNRCGLSGGVRARERLRPRRLFQRNVARRHGTLLDREHRPAGFPIEHEQHPGLRGLDDRGDRHAVARQRDERRRRSVVVVPEIVVNGLERPDERPVDALNATIEFA